MINYTNLRDDNYPDTAGKPQIKSSHFTQESCSTRSVNKYDWYEFTLPRHIFLFLYVQA